MSICLTWVPIWLVLCGVIVVGLVLYSIILYFHEYVSGLQIVERGNLQECGDFTWRVGV